MRASDIKLSALSVDGFVAHFEHPFFGNKMELNVHPSSKEAEGPSEIQFKAMEFLLNPAEGFLCAFYESMFLFQSGCYAPEEEDDPVITRGNIRDHCNVSMAVIPSHALIQDDCSYFFLLSEVTWYPDDLLQTMVRDGVPILVQGFVGGWSSERWVLNYPDYFPQPSTDPGQGAEE